MLRARSMPFQVGVTRAAKCGIFRVGSGQSIVSVWRTSVKEETPTSMFTEEAPLQGVARSYRVVCSSKFVQHALPSPILEV